MAWPAHGTVEGAGRLEWDAVKPEYEKERRHPELRPSRKRRWQKCYHPNFSNENRRRHS